MSVSADNNASIRIDSQPVVSVGIPTYNRPGGLSRTLACIIAQTYRNLEIILSDNASPGDETEKVAREFMAIDPRIRYVRQPENIGVSLNFKFVLKHATGKYFMWAADDDEWDARFVEVSVGLLEQGAVSAMTGFDTLYRVSGKRFSNTLPDFSPRLSCGRNFYKFLSRPTPSLFYGVHRRLALQFFLDENQWFDYYDCYFILKLILQGPIAIWPETLYTAGIDAPTYQIKPAEQGRGLRLMPFLHAANTLLASDRFSVTERLWLKSVLVYFGVRRYLWYLVQLARASIARGVQRHRGSENATVS
jgi:glycosyltransferase involved in cell wall biosynthesis